MKISLQMLTLYAGIYGILNFSMFREKKSHMHVKIGWQEPICYV